MDSAVVPDSTTDAVSVDAAPEATAEGGGDAGGCGTAPFPNLTTNCTQVSCLHATQITCETSVGACQTTMGGRPLDCGSTADCDAAACCVNSTITVATGCPNVAPLGAATTITACSTNTLKQCAGGQAQVCLTSAECFGGLTCEDAVFDVNGTKAVHFGVCR
jgi:hypothetical protein